MPCECAADPGTTKKKQLLKNICTNEVSRRAICRVSITPYAHKSAPTSTSNVADDSDSPTGLAASTVPVKARPTAAQRIHPTCSPNNGAARSVMMTGAVKIQRDQLTQWQKTSRIEIANPCHQRDDTAPYQQGPRRRCCGVPQQRAAAGPQAADVPGLRFGQTISAKPAQYRPTISPLRPALPAWNRRAMPASCQARVARSSGTPTMTKQRLSDW